MATPAYQPPPVGYSTYPGGSIFYTQPTAREATAPSAQPGAVASGNSPGAVAPGVQSGNASDCTTVTADGRRTTTTSPDCKAAQNRL